MFKSRSTDRVEYTVLDMPALSPTFSVLSREGLLEVSAHVHLNMSRNLCVIRDHEKAGIVQFSVCTWRQKNIESCVVLK